MLDADHPCFLFGGTARAGIFEWLGADLSIDFQTKQRVDDAVSVFQVPFMFTALFYPPLELPVRPYGQIGFGFTITDVTVPGPGTDDTDLNALFHFGFGAEYELAKNVLVDGNLRFVFATDPPHAGDFDAHWIQFTIGILFKLSN
jgi:opacity protein-like surface antigen